VPPFLTWLIQGAVGPALVGLPVTWAATDWAGAAKRWFRRLRQSDGLSRIVRAAASGFDLCDDEFAAVRELLERESTWVEVGRGTVEELAALIASCLQGRPGEGSLKAGRGIAGGLLEFAVRDLEPEWFRQVLFARLDRMQADQASALDQAMLCVHADLAALLAHQDAADGDRFARVLGQLARVLDRLPPGPADRGDVAVYLARLIRWLNTEPWPQDMRFGGPALAPAAIERKLRIASSGGGGQDLDADDLARRCSRLVVLGGPGSGKTWLARRTARLCAAAALDALAAGAGPEEVELPLYTTCARLAAAPPGEGIRRAVVGSALGQLPDLGGSRVYEALRVLFEDRDAPTLLVADSLDEARGDDDRIRGAETLPSAWRIVLTSRPGRWNSQLVIGRSDPDRRVGALQPLDYPGDVESFIAQWFAGRPVWGENLAKQLAQRPALQQAATVPLILAFYCIIGGDQPLPGRWRELYSKVIHRMLTGRWRDGSDRDPDPEACMDTLRDWAWSAAASNPMSGTGEWADEFAAPRIRQSVDDRDALGHVAVLLGPPCPDTGKTKRRFVHRSLREHLVAEYIALRMPAEQAAGELLNHLWYDPDWQYAAPAALAMHPERDRLLRELMCRAARSDAVPADISVIDAAGEFKRFLARVASESGEASWSPENAAAIGRARVDLAVTGRIDGIDPAPQWGTSNRQARENLLRRLADETRRDAARTLAEILIVLGPDEADRLQAFDKLLLLLSREVNSWAAQQLADMLIRLGAPVGHLHLACEKLLQLLREENQLYEARALAHTIVRFGPGEAERRQACDTLLDLVARDPDGLTAAEAADAIAILTVTADQRSNAREHLTSLMDLATNGGAVLSLAEALARLQPTAAERRQARRKLVMVLAAGAVSWAGDVAKALSGLTASAEEERETREELLEALFSSKPSSSEVVDLAMAFARLDPAPQEQHDACEKILDLFERCADSESAQDLAVAVMELDPDPESRCRMRQHLLELIESETDARFVGTLASILVRSGPSEQEERQATERLLGLLLQEADGEQAWYLWEVLAKFKLTTHQRHQARQKAMELLFSGTSGRVAADLAEMLIGPGLTQRDRHKARQRMRELLSSATDVLDVAVLCDAIARLDPTTQERHEVRQILLGILKSPDTDIDTAGGVIETMASMALTPGERCVTRKELLQLILTETDFEMICLLLTETAEMAVTEEDQQDTRHSLLELLNLETDSDKIWKLVETMTELRPTPEDQSRARERMLELLATETSGEAAWGLIETTAGLAPTIDDLATSPAWAASPTANFLTETRKNSPLPAWLAVLPSLIPSTRPAHPKPARGRQNG